MLFQYDPSVSDIWQSVIPDSYGRIMFQNVFGCGLWSVYLVEMFDDPDESDSRVVLEFRPWRGDNFKLVVWYGYTTPDGWYLDTSQGMSVELVGQDRARLETALSNMGDDVVRHWYGEICVSR